MVEIPLSRGMVALVDDGEAAALLHWKWHALKVKKPTGRAKFYAARSDYSTGKMILMHREIMLAGIGQKVDHRNPEATLDNRRTNLRIVSNMQNSWNSRKRPGSASSRFKGVWKTDSGKWCAELMCQGKKICLGRFADEVDAATAYNFAAHDAFEEFARYNEPEGSGLQRREDL